MIKAIYFDLFFTLIIPAYEKTNNEFDILNLPVGEWEQYAENEILYRERALGLVKTETEIIDRITSIIPFEVSDVQKEQILYAREQRMKNALKTVSKEISDVLQKLKSMDIKLGLISNADCIDCKYWNRSPLYQYFNDAVFSCNVGMLKPDRQIYELAMQHLNVSSEQCLFVGDGGSNELCGAKSAGMGTVFSEMLETKTGEQRKNIIKYADYHIKHINELFCYL
ncbi:MAG: HAD family hydrolase, partial [Oscillospiraceae bacterium]|nr:HAD family hydrolase [Oscillospiraceae bacterium]